MFSRRAADRAQKVRDLFEAGRAAWPEINVDPERFADHVTTRLPEGEAPLEKHAGDLFLTCALTAGDSRAVAAFERCFLSEISSYLAKDHPAVADEAKQLLRERLLLGPTPRIASYAGRGPLGAWLRMAAVRTARDLLRAQKQHLPLEEGQLRSAAPDPEMSYLKQRYGREFKSAFQSVLESLPKRERTILRLYFFDAMTVTEIGAVYRVHASTVARWIARSRQTILSETRRLLRDRLRLSSREFESLMAVVQSRLDVSLHQLLRDP
jgi:RNA polymerase sigma-70 factor (ECF subfamily)